MTAQTTETPTDNVHMFGVSDKVRAALDRVDDAVVRQSLVKIYGLRMKKFGSAAADKEVIREVQMYQRDARTPGGRAQARTLLAAAIETFERGDGIEERLRRMATYSVRGLLFGLWLITKPFTWIIERIRAYPLAGALAAVFVSSVATLYASLSVRESITPVAFELPEPALPHFANIHAVRHAGRVFVDTREPGVVFLETITKDGRIAAIYKCAASNPPPPRVEDIVVVAKAPSPELGPRTTVDQRILYDCRHQREAVAHLKSRYADGRPIPVGSTRLASDPRYKSVDAADVPVATVRRARPHNIDDAAPLEPLKKP